MNSTRDSQSHIWLRRGGNESQLLIDATVVPCIRPTLVVATNDAKIVVADEAKGEDVLVPPGSGQRTKRWIMSSILFNVVVVGGVVYCVVVLQGNEEQGGRQHEEELGLDHLLEELRSLMAPISAVHFSTSTTTLHFKPVAATTRTMTTYLVSRGRRDGSSQG